MDEPLLSVGDVASLLHVPPSWVYAQAEAKTLPSFKIGKYRRFQRAEVEAWLAQRHMGTGNGSPA